MKILGIIPARGGSKGVPFKNKRPIGGKPLIAYAIDVALESNVCTTLVVSSDDNDILSYADKRGILIHKRAGNLATDKSPVTDTVSEVLAYAERVWQTEYDAILLLQPTAPLREAHHLQEAVALLQEHAMANSVISVAKSGDCHPARMYTVQDKVLHSLEPDYEQQNRQQLPAVYIRNGAIYIVRTKAFSTTKYIMAKPALAYVMDTSYHVNIDEPKDFLLAKIFLENGIDYATKLVKNDSYYKSV